eukprot:9336561-Ditylum_brightwellii.AAC.1
MDPVPIIGGVDYDEDKIGDETYLSDEDENKDESDNERKDEYDAMDENKVADVLNQAHPLPTVDKDNNKLHLHLMKALIHPKNMSLK